jgi:hypothetical protein
MRFDTIRLIGLDTVDLPIIGASPSNPYICKNVDGLGPTEVDVSISNTLYQGGIRQGRRPQLRQIIARVGLNPDWSTGETASDLRDSLYGLLSNDNGDLAEVHLMDGANVAAKTSGDVSKVEIVPFSKTPEVQLTIDCTQPYLEAEDPITTSTLDKVNTVVDNVGSHPTGFYVEVTLTSNLSSWAFRNDDLSKEMLITYSLLSGDKILFDTNPGSRSIKINRSSTITDMLPYLSNTSEWLMMHKGVNTFHPSSSAFNWNAFTYTPKYRGI